MNLKKIKIFLYSLLLIFFSCREEIISPDNPTGNINEPFLTRTGNSYIFSINASNITAMKNNSPNINTGIWQFNSEFIIGFPIKAGLPG